MVSEWTRWRRGTGATTRHSWSYGKRSPYSHTQSSQRGWIASAWNCQPCRANTVRDSEWQYYHLSCAQLLRANREPPRSKGTSLAQTDRLYGCDAKSDAASREAGLGKRDAH